jgi:iron complex transport system substrate-binding protein
MARTRTIAGAIIKRRIVKSSEKYAYRPFSNLSIGACEVKEAFMECGDLAPLLATKGTKHRSALCVFCASLWQLTAFLEGFQFTATHNRLCGGMIDNGTITSFPQRIICLTEETTETLYLLGEEDRIVGVSGYTVRPPEARRKPKVSSFIAARFDKILALEPDLVFGFSDLQADISAELIRRGVTVLTFNQRSVQEILQMMITVGRIVGRERKAQQVVDSLTALLQGVEESASHLPSRPRVFFEEWNDPLISGIRWVDELIEIAGGEPLFPELRLEKSAKDRIVRPEEVKRRNPDVIIASWCGRPVKKAQIRNRDGWSEINAVRLDNIFEVKSTYILQPGPAALTEGVRQIHLLIAKACGVELTGRLMHAPWEPHE